MTVPSHEFYIHSEITYREDRAQGREDTWQRIEGRRGSWLRRAAQQAARRRNNTDTIAN